MDFVKQENGKQVALTGAINTASLSLVPRDVYFSGIALCRTKGSSTSVLITTATEVVVVGKGGIEIWRAPLKNLQVSTRGMDYVVLKTDVDTLEIGLGLSSRKKLVEHLAMAQVVTEESEKIVKELVAADALAPQLSADDSALKSPMESWPNAKIIGARLTQKASNAILRQCYDDAPWLILVSSGGGGLLAAFDDRLTIIKTGGLTSLMAGSFGGERSTSFYFRDITGLEYNSGMVNGVLEIMTASYNGTANRDFWRGTGKSRNANGDDPYTLSNTLPLSKVEYNSALGEIQDLRRRIAKSKEQIFVAPTPSSEPTRSSDLSLGDELLKLAELNKSGILSDEEFQAAKKRLLG